MSINQLVNTKELRKIALSRKFQFYYDGFGYRPCKPSEDDLVDLKVFLSGNGELKFSGGRSFYVFSDR